MTGVPGYTLRSALDPRTLSKAARSVRRSMCLLISPSTRVVGEVRRLAAHVEPLRRHRAVTHLTVAVTALAVAVAFAIPAAPMIQAGLQTTPRTGSILPANVGIGVAGSDAVVLHFPGPMDQAAVATGIGLSPATRFSLLWAGDSTSVALVPSPRWAVDERYVIHLPAGTAMADGGALSADWRAAFTTQTAPSVTHLTVGEVNGTPADDTPIVLQEVMSSTGAPAGSTADDAATDGRGSPDASADAPIGITFSAAMDAETTEAAFHIAPAVSGSFHWEGTTLWFQPDQRLAAGTRHTISLVGARDIDGNPLGGDVSFSFTTRVRAEAIKVAPAIGARGVPATTSVRIVFTQSMATARTAAAFTVTDTATGRAVFGRAAWSADGRTLTFVPTSSLGAGHTFAAVLGTGARDADDNPVTFSWRFTTDGPAVQSSSSSVPVAQGSANMVQYALNQINAARASYGLGALVVDSTITAVAYGHAADMLGYNYFSHSSRNGATYKQRLTAGGVSYGYSGENICYLGYGGGVQATLNWCHAQFWAEPFPGGGNHKDNILSGNFQRVGIGIAVGGNKVYVVWDFTD